MPYPRRARRLLPVFFLLLVPAVLLAQEAGIDERFQQAREAAFAERYEEARRICRSILEEAPDYHEVRVLMGRTYAWEERFAEAREIFQEVLERDPRNRGAFGALADVAYWSGDFGEAARLTGRALDFHPGAPELMDRRIRILVAMKRYREAGLLFSRLQRSAPGYDELDGLREMVGSYRFINGLRAAWGYDRYSDLYDPSHEAFLQYRRTTGMGPVIGRLRLQRRFGENGLQGEVDWYPVFGEGFYAYLSYAYSGSRLYPEHRAGLEVYHRLPLSMEVSLGARQLVFAGGESVTLLTGSLSAYAGSYYLSLKPYVVPRSSGVDRSAVLLVRRYLGGPDSYLWISGSMGVSPTERTYQRVEADIFSLESWGAAAGLRRYIGSSVSLELSVEYERQERLDMPGSFLDILTLNTQFGYRF